MEFEDGDEKDLWEYQELYNKAPEQVVTDENRLLKKEQPKMTLVEAYRSAWFTVYQSLSEGRKKEVDKFSKGDTLPLTRFEKEFAGKVEKLVSRIFATG